jgi:hypothetical protein
MVLAARLSGEIPILIILCRVGFCPGTFSRILAHVTTKRKTGGGNTRNLLLVIHGVPVARICDKALDYPEAPAMILRAIGSAIEEIHAARSHTGKADAAGGQS